MSSSTKNKITVVGSGYVGMSLAVLLSQHDDVTVLDIDIDKVAKINDRKSTVSDLDIENFLSSRELNLSATTDSNMAFTESDLVIVATPTNYDPITSKFDTSSVDGVVELALSHNNNCSIVIKSTIPVGHTDALKKLHKNKSIFFSPEFLREGKALYDNLYPSRIVIGSKCEAGKLFAAKLCKAAKKKNIDTLFVESIEAESIKLFANTYLAMRVAFFNELDTYAFSNDLNVKNIIDGISLDDRIGKGYNNPSFGYGGYCLPKDTKQLLANYGGIPQTLITAIVSSNRTRKDFISKKIIEHKPKVVGFYRLAMKKNSDNFRSSATISILKRLIEKGIRVVVFEPDLSMESFNGASVIKSLKEFKSISDIIVANRKDDSLKDVYNKVFSRDQYGEN